MSLKINPNHPVKLCSDCRFNEPGGHRCSWLDKPKNEARQECGGKHWQLCRTISRGLAEVRLHVEVYSHR